MSITGNELQNNSLAAMQARAPEKVVNAIQTASHKTGVDFSYLMHKAGVESSFRPEIKAKTSSATGLYQFIESTWLEMVKKHGDKYGLDKHAAQISDDLRVSSNEARQSILHLRKDPELAALMAGEYAAENKAFLERTVGGEIGNTELYLAHFMGPSGAAAFLQEHRHNPAARASDIFPREANANRNVFYDPSTGRARSLDQVYAFFDKKFEGSEIIEAPRQRQNVNQTENIAQVPTETQRTQSQIAREEKAYQHIPPSLYGQVETRGNWNKKSSSQNVQNALPNQTDFGTRIARVAAEVSLAAPTRTESRQEAQLLAHNLYSKLSISPTERSFVSRLNR